MHQAGYDVRTSSNLGASALLEKESDRCEPSAVPAPANRHPAVMPEQTIRIDPRASLPSIPVQDEARRRGGLPPPSSTPLRTSAAPPHAPAAVPPGPRPRPKPTLLPPRMQIRRAVPRWKVNAGPVRIQPRHSPAGSPRAGSPRPDAGRLPQGASPGPAAARLRIHDALRPQGTGRTGVHAAPPIRRRPAASPRRDAPASVSSGLADRPRPGRGVPSAKRQERARRAFAGRRLPPVARPRRHPPLQRGEENVVNRWRGSAEQQQEMRPDASAQRGIGRSAGLDTPGHRRERRGQEARRQGEQSDPGRDNRRRERRERAEQPQEDRVGHGGKIVDIEAASRSDTQAHPARHAEVVKPSSSSRRSTSAPCRPPWASTHAAHLQAAEGP